MKTEPEDDGFPVDILDEGERRRHPLLLAGVMVAIAVVAGLGGYTYSRLSTDKTPAEVPLVRAEPGPTKERPAEPGGMTIPDQDKLVYQSLTGNGSEGKVERLLPPPEEPMPPPSPSAPKVAAAPVEKAAPPAPAPAAKVIEKTAPPAAALPPAPKVEPKAPVKKVVNKAVNKAKKAAKATATSGAYLVQIASFRSKAKADAAWARYGKTHGDLLRGLEPLVRRVDLGAEKGVYYRLRAGPLGTLAEARALCAKLKARKLGCFVVKQ